MEAKLERLRVGDVKRVLRIDTSDMYSQDVAVPVLRGDQCFAGHRHDGLSKPPGGSTEKS